MSWHVIRVLMSSEIDKIPKIPVSGPDLGVSLPNGFLWEIMGEICQLVEEGGAEYLSFEKRYQKSGQSISDGPLGHVKSRI